MKKPSTLPATTTKAAPPAAAPAATLPPEAPVKLKSVLQGQMERFRETLPEHLTPERMISIINICVYRNPNLQKCDHLSIVMSSLRAAALGLDLEPSLMEAFLIPRWNKNIGERGAYECTFQPGYQGLRKLALQSDKIALLEARLVREGDYFEHRYAPDLVFRHDPSNDGTKLIVGVYSFAKLMNGERSVEYMTTDQVEAIHERSEGFRKSVQDQKPEVGPWVTDWAEMARKTVLKRHCKSLPRSVQLATAIDYDDEEYRRGTPTVLSAPPSRPQLPAGTRAEKVVRQLTGDPEELPEPSTPRDAPKPREDAPAPADDDRDILPDDVVEMPEGREPGED